MGLACYKAKQIAQGVCGPATPGDRGTRIVPGQPPHTRLSGVSAADAFVAASLDTIKAFELCVPAVIDAGR